jgi:hypothetical protein
MPPLLGCVHADAIGREIRTMTTKTTEECQLMVGRCLVATKFVERFFRPSAKAVFLLGGYSWLYEKGISYKI